MSSRFLAKHAALLQSLQAADKDFGYPMHMSQVQGAAQVSAGCLMQAVESEPAEDAKKV